MLLGDKEVGDASSQWLLITEFCHASQSLAVARPTDDLQGAALGSLEYLWPR